MRMALNMHHAACFPKLRLITMPCTMLPLPPPPPATAAAVVPRSLTCLRSGSQAVSSSSSTSRAGGLRSVGYKFEPPDISSSLALNSNGDGNTASRVMASDAHSSLMASDAHSSSGVYQLTTVGKASDVAIDSELRKAAKQSSSGDVYSGERTKPSVQVMRRTLPGHQDRRNYSEHQVSLSRNATSRLSMFGSDVPWPSVQALKDAQSCLEERLPHDLPGYSPRPGSSEFTSAESRKPVFLEKASTAMPNGGGLPWLKKVEEMNAETRNSREKSEGNDSVLDDGRAVSTSNVAKKGLDVEPEHIQRLCVEGEHKREPSSEEFFFMKEELVIPPILVDRSKKQFLSRGIRGVSPVTGSQTFGKISDTVSPTMPETKTENGLGNGQPSRGGTSESVMTLTVENVVAEESLTMKCEYAVPSLIQDKNQFSSSSIKDGSRESGFESVAKTSLVYSEAVLPNYLVCQPENSSRIQFDNCAEELQASQKTKTSEIEGSPQEGKSFFHPPFKEERHSKIEHATPRIRSQSNQENPTAELKVDPDLINHQKIGQHAIRIKKKGGGSSGSAKKVNQHTETLVTCGRITQLSPQMPDLERATQKVEEASLLQGSSDEKIVNPKSSDVRMLQVSKLKDSTDVKLVCSMEDVVIVNNVADARNVVSHLRENCKELIHACDTEVTDINVKKESPVGHGKVICFSIYCGPQANFGSGKTGVWVDVLDGGEEIIAAFKEYFEDPSIKKVWHNFSFDKHVLGNHGIKAQGFYADTMHLARLWNSGRKGAEGGYSLESLTGDPKVMDGAHSWKAHEFTKKTSMKDLFGVNNIKKDGTEGKLKSLPPVVELQRSDHSKERWICYSVGDAMSTWRLWESLQAKLRNTEWVLQGKTNGTMYDFYEAFWQPFGELLTQMEAEGMLVDRCYLAEIEKTAVREQHVSASRFRKWATKYCPDAQYINVTSDCQVRQLLFGGLCAKRMSQEAIPVERIFNVPNVDEYIEEGRKAPKKSRRIKIRGIGLQIPVNQYTNNGLPAVSIQALKEMAGKVSVDYSCLEEAAEEQVLDDEGLVLTSTGVKGGTDNESMDKSIYGTAYPAFGGGEEGKEACEAIAALCEVSAIDTLISNFIQPLQGGDILGPDGRVHCSLNLNTETGRLSARRPNLQNQPALEKDRYKIRQAFIASPGNSLIVADYGQLELRILAHLANCKSMLQAFKVGGDFHSRTAMNMYDHVRKAVENKEVLLEWEPKPGDDSPPAPLLKDIFGSERRKAKMLNFSIAYGKTAIGLAKDWKVTLDEAKETLDLWYKDRHEVRVWQDKRKEDARVKHCVHTLLGRARHFPDVRAVTGFWKGHIERAAINTPVQGSAADVAMCAMLEIAGNAQLRELGWKLLLQIHDEVILEGPTNTAELAKDLVVKAMSYPFKGKNFLNVELAVDAKFAESWYAAK